VYVCEREREKRERERERERERDTDLPVHSVIASYTSSVRLMANKVLVSFVTAYLCARAAR